MAMNSSVKKAQISVNCQLCEIDSRIKWKCMDCDLLMCTKCYDKIHPKFKNANHHEIIDIKEVGKEGSVKRLDFTNIKCKKHPDQFCCIFCTTCGELACPSCLTSAHSGHTFKDIKEAHGIKMNKLRDEQKMAETNIEKLNKDLQELSKIKSNEDAKYKKTLQGIQSQKDAWIKEVHERADVLSKEVQRNIEPILKSVSDEEKKVLTVYNELKQQNNTVEDIANTTDMSRFFDEVDQVGKSLVKPLPPVKVSHGCMPTFVPNKIIFSSIGTLEENRPFQVNIKVDKIFQTEMKYIHHLSMCQDNSMWMGDSVSKKLQKVKLQGITIIPKSSVDTPLRGIAVTHNDDLLISYAGLKLKQIDAKTGKRADSIYSATPLLIMPVHVSYDNKIVVGAISDNQDEPLYPASGRRVVIVMDMNGKQLELYEYENTKTRMFTYASDVSMARTGSIGVVDHVSSDLRGRVLVVKNGGVMGIYSGHQNVNTNDKPFKPRSIVVTPSDNFIVSDLYTNTIHVLDNTGKFIAYCDTASKAIVLPYSLVYSATGQLYIGCTTLIDKPDKAKLYRVEISDV